MKTLYRIITVVTASIFLMACSTDFSQSPYGENDGIAPGSVKVNEVININGGAYILFDLPSDTDVLYVKAEYTNSQNEIQNSIVSAYADTIKIEGLGDTKSRTVNIYAVDHFGNQSNPVKTTIEPLEPAVSAAFASLKSETSFGGFNLDFENIMRNPLSFYIYMWSEEKSQWILSNVSTSSMAKGTLQIKGFESVLTKFAVEVRDKWGNTSDKYEFELKPLYEIQLDKKKFSAVEGLVGDCDWNQYEARVERMWDDIWNMRSGYGHTSYPVETGWPHCFTVDLGVNAKISQFAFWPRQDNPDLFYAHGFPYQFGIYGCPEDKDYRDASNYVKLYEGYTVRPSGLPFGDANTAEDIQKGYDGQLFTMDQSAPSVRYIKFKSYMSWSGMECSVVAEISVWGAPDSN